LGKPQHQQQNAFGGARRFALRLLVLCFFHVLCDFEILEFLRDILRLPANIRRRVWHQSGHGSDRVCSSTRANTVTRNIPGSS
jgi:hypothetical protein